MPYHPSHSTHIRFLQWLCFCVAAITTSATASAQVNHQQHQQLSFSVIITGESAGSLEAMVVYGGAWTTPRKLVHTAVLIMHPEGNLLWDTGLSGSIDAQMAAFSWWQKMLFRVESVTPASAQLVAAGFPLHSITAIIPSHLHWDHASGLEDFPDTPVWVRAAERKAALSGNPPAFIKAQYDNPAIRWRDLELDAIPYEGFALSKDVYGDGKIVLVDLSGHTRGQLGLFINLTADQRYFFIADTAWAVKGVKENKGRPGFVDALVGVDRDYSRNAAQLERIHQLSLRLPELVIVPAHDETINRSLAIFPAFTSAK